MMKKTPLPKILTRNWKAKLLALTLATAIWFLIKGKDTTPNIYGNTPNAEKRSEF